MSLELTMLFWSTTLFAGYIGVQSVFYRLDKGVEFANGSRDNEPPSNVWTMRSEKALRNLLETYPVFVALALAIELGGHSDALTQWGVHLYFWSRWVYLPLYVFGVKQIRSLVWLVSALGLTLMFAGVLF